MEAKESLTTASCVLKHRVWQTVANDLLKLLLKMNVSQDVAGEAD